MRVLLLTYEFYPINGGVGNASLALCRAMRDQLNAEVGVVACVSWWPWEKPLRFERYENFSIYRIKYTGIPEDRPLRQSLRSAYCLFQFIRVVMKLKPDAIISQRVFDLGIAGALAARLTGATSLTYAHGPDDVQHAEHKKLRKRLNGIAMKMNDATMTTNRFYQAFLQSCKHDIPVYVVPNIVEGNERERQRRLGSGDTLHIACAGRMVVEHGVETKGFSYAVRSMKDLTDCHLHVFGDGSHRPNLETLVHELGIDSSVTFHGKTSREELLTAFASMDIFLHPALYDGLPLVVLEAMNAGLPVIATHSGGLPDVVHENETGWLIKQADAGSIAEVINRLQKNKEILPLVGERARRFINEYASVESVTEKLRPLLIKAS